MSNVNIEVIFVLGLCVFAIIGAIVSYIQRRRRIAKKKELKMESLDNMTTRPILQVIYKFKEFYRNKMGKTFKDRKIHQGQIQKAINLEEKKKQEEYRKEAEEAKRWEDPKSISNASIKKEKEMAKQRKKEELKRKYEEEYRQS